MNIFGFLMAALMAFSVAEAKTIVISDIDDTLKNSHVLDWTDALFNAGKIKNVNLGINTLFGLVFVNAPDTKFFYVTNAPESLMKGKHTDFLKENRFPTGSLRLRGSLTQKDFKLTEIRKILKEQKPQYAILIGDNGEKDILVYQQIVKEFPQVLFLTYIRMAYSNRNVDAPPGASLQPGQTGFSTSLDLMLHLRHEGFVHPTDAISFVRDFMAVYAREKDVNSDGPQAMPAWFDCRDFQWTALDADLVGSASYVRAKTRILERCEASPITMAVD